MKKLLSFLFIALMPVAGLCVDSDVTRDSMHPTNKHLVKNGSGVYLYVYPDLTQWNNALEDGKVGYAYECGSGDIKVGSTVFLPAGHVYWGQEIDHYVRYLCRYDDDRRLWWWQDASCVGLNGEIIPFAQHAKGDLTKEQCAEYSSTFTDENGLVYNAVCRKDQEFVVCKAKTCWDNSAADGAGKCPAKPAETKTTTTAAKRPTGNGAGYCKLQTRDFTGTSDYDMDEYLYRDSGTWEFYASSRARPVGSAVQVYECNGRSDAPDDACPEGATKILRAGAGIGNQTVASTGEYVFVCTNNSSIKSDSYKWLYTPIQERCLYTSSNVPTQDNIDGQMLYYSSDYNVYCRNIEQVATKAEADQKMGPAGRDGKDGKDGKDGRDGKDATQTAAGTNATGMHTIEATAKITTSRNDAASMQSRQSASQSRISRLSGKLKEMQEGFKVTVWRNEDGTFNTTRLASDSIAAVVLGTTGGLVTSHVVKKNQVNKGFDDIQCTVGGQSVAGWGDEFRVGIQ